MAENLGRIEKPEVADYEEGRKLFFAPLIFIPPKPPADLAKIAENYWEQAEEQLGKLEASFSSVTKVYHELIPIGGKEGLGAMKELNSASYQFANTRLRKGAELQPFEDTHILTEFMDWSRCITIALQNQDVFNKIYEAYLEAQRKRNEHIAKQIAETLKENEVGLLLMREGHQIQFPSDIKIFYIAPPSLDEIKRWLRTRKATEETDTQANDKQSTHPES